MGTAEEKRCALCGAAFGPRTVMQKYCGRECSARAAYMRKRGMWREEAPGRSFDCAYCGEHVTVREGDARDRRRRFCCAECERKYWKHPGRYG